MKKKLIKQMQQILLTSILISEGMDHSAFCDYSGHMEFLYIRIVKKEQLANIYQAQVFLNISDHPETDLNRILEDMQKYIPKEKK